MTYEEEIERLKSIIVHKNKALDKAAEELLILRREMNYYIDRTKQLKAEKRDLITVLNRKSRPVNMRSDQNWDSRPREIRSEHNE